MFLAALFTFAFVLTISFHILSAFLGFISLCTESSNTYNYNNDDKPKADTVMWRT